MKLSTDEWNINWTNCEAREYVLLNMILATLLEVGISKILCKKFFLKGLFYNAQGRIYNNVNLHETAFHNSFKNL